MVTVERWGTGRPDYSKYVHEALRTKTIKEYDLKPNEKFKAFNLVCDEKTSAFPWVKGLLPPGEEWHLIDVETGLEMPYTIPQGYDFKWLILFGNSNQPSIGYSYTDGQLDSTIQLVDFSVYHKQEVNISLIEPIDPTFSSSHTYDLTIKNLGNTSARGNAYLLCVLKRVHSPEIKTKDVKCGKCGYIKRGVPLSLTKWKCERCGALNFYRYFPFGGR